MVGGFKHGFIFHFIYGMSSFPLTNSLHHFSRWAHCTTNQMVVRIYTRLPWPSWRQRWRQMLCWGDGSPGVSWGHGGKFTSGVWDFTVVAMAISELTGYFYGIIHSINGVFLVLITGILGHNCRGKMRRNRSLRTRFCWRFSWPLNGLKDVRAPPLDPWFVITHISSHQWGSSMNLIGFLFIPLRFVGLTTPPTTGSWTGSGAPRTRATGRPTICAACSVAAASYAVRTATVAATSCCRCWQRRFRFWQRRSRCWWWRRGRRKCHRCWPWRGWKWCLEEFLYVCVGGYIMIIYYNIYIIIYI